MSPTEPGTTGGSAAIAASSLSRRGGAEWTRLSSSTMDMGSTVGSVAMWRETGHPRICRRSRVADGNSPCLLSSHREDVLGGQIARNVQIVHLVADLVEGFGYRVSDQVCIILPNDCDGWKTRGVVVEVEVKDVSMQGRPESTRVGTSHVNSISRPLLRCLARSLMAACDKQG
jgi:hypothetical protein